MSTIYQVIACFVNYQKCLQNKKIAINMININAFFPLDVENAFEKTQFRYLLPKNIILPVCTTLFY